LVLLAFLIAIRMNPGMITLSWDSQDLLMILLGLGVSQRSALPSARRRGAR
jgi:hypothetical protein